VIDLALEGVVTETDHLGRGYFIYSQNDFGHRTPTARTQEEEISKGLTSSCVSLLTCTERTLSMWLILSDTRYA
jgi:hypothetical protein